MLNLFVLKTSPIDVKTRLASTSLLFYILIETLITLWDKKLPYYIYF